MKNPKYFHTDENSGTPADRRDARLFRLITDGISGDKRATIASAVAAISISEDDARRLRRLADRIWRIYA